MGDSVVPLRAPSAEPWRDIRCVDVRWEVATGENNQQGRVRLTLYKKCNPHAMLWDGEKTWVGLTLGDLADRGPMWWKRTTSDGFGDKTVAAVKLVIDMAAAGVDVTLHGRPPGDPFGPYKPRPWRRVT